MIFYVHAYYSFVKMCSCCKITLICQVVCFSRKCIYRLQVTVIEIFPPPIPEASPSAAVTPSTCSPANGMSPSTSSDPSPSLDSRVSVIVNVNNTPVVNKGTLLTNKYVYVLVEITILVYFCCT